MLAVMLPKIVKKTHIMKEEIKEAILDLLKKNDDYSFSELIFELKKLIIDVDGDRDIFYKENLLLWHNVSPELTKAINELITENKIAVKVLKGNEALLIYSYAGIIPDLPIAEDYKRAYKKLHWLPVIIKKY